MMKMLLISNGSILKMAGGDYHLFKVAAYWSKHNDVRLIVPSPVFGYVNDLFPDKAVVSSTPLENGSASGFRAIFIYILRIFRSLFFNFNTQFDVIVASSHYPHDVIPAILQKLRNHKAKLVVYAHGMFPEVPATNGLFLRSVSLVYNYLGGLIAIRAAKLVYVFNRHSQTYIRRLSHDKVNTVLSSNGVDLRYVHNDDNRREFDGAFLGRVVCSKGIFDLVKIWKKVCEKKVERKIVVIGSGMNTELMQATKSEGVSQNFVLAGHADEQRKFELLTRSNVFVFPSYTEGWGIAIAEAMACGLPVVAYRLPVYREVFGDKLVTVPVGDIDGMAKSVTYLLENPSIAANIGQSNKQFVKRYEWEAVAKKELNAIQNITGSDLV